MDDDRPRDDSALFRIGLRRSTAEAIGARVERWQVEHAAAMAVYDLEDFITELANLGDATLVLADEFHRRLWAEPLGVIDPFLVGEAMRDLFDVLARRFTLVIDLGERTEAAGYDLPGLAGLKDVRKRMADKAAWFRSIWPRVDPEMEAQAMEDYRAGCVLTAEEAIRELLDQPAPEHHH